MLLRHCNGWWLTIHTTIQRHHCQSEFLMFLAWQWDTKWTSVSWNWSLWWFSTYWPWHRCFKSKCGWHCLNRRNRKNSFLPIPDCRLKKRSTSYSATPVSTTWSHNNANSRTWTSKWVYYSLLGDSCFSKNVSWCLWWSYQPSFVTRSIIRRKSQTPHHVWRKKKVPSGFITLPHTQDLPTGHLIWLKESIFFNKQGYFWIRILEKHIWPLKRLNKWHQPTI